MSNQKEKKMVVYTIRIKNRKERNHGENLVATFAMVGSICPPNHLPPGGDTVRVSENLGVTKIVPVAPVDTFLKCFNV